VLTVPKGIVYLYGKNMLKADGNGNAAGKSAFASSIAEIFYDPMVGTKQDKVKTGSRFIEFVQDKKTIKIGSKFSGKTEKLTLSIDGEDKSGRVNKNTREQIETYWPITENEYKTYGYIDSNLPHPLARGSSTERKTFFSSFFGLDKLDAERKLISAELSKIKKVKAAYNELNSTFLEIKKDMLAKQERVVLEEEQEKLGRIVSKLRDESAKYQRIKQLVEFKKFASVQIKALLKVIPDLEEFETVYKTTRKKIAQLEQMKEQLQEWRDYKRDLAKYEKEIEGLDMSVPLDVLKQASRQYERALLAVEDGEDLEAPKRVKKPSAPEVGERKELTAALVTAEHQLEHAAKFKKGVCHTCGQAVKAEPIEKIKARVERLQLSLDAWEEYDNDLRAYERYVAKVKDYEERKAALDAAKFSIKQFELKHKLYKKRASILKPEVVNRPKEIDEGGNDLEELKVTAELLRFCQPHLDTIAALQTLTKEDQEVQFDTEKLNRMQDKLASIQAKLEVHNAVKSRAAKMRSRLLELQADMESEEALTLLLDGYSDKAVKKMVIEAISQHLMATVNQYSSIVFDDYRFEFVWSASQIQILVHRPKMDTTDVRKLSGAESKLFTLILVLSLLKFVPKRKRLSLLVLDEPTASFSEETTELFHRLLPHLNQLIPTILVITPKANERLEGSTELTVLRDREGARIVKGHPNEI
jgi:DNA repair exonuclease SbcCD ATPase subunit